MKGLIKKSSRHGEAPGLERVILGKLPLYSLGGTLIPVFMSLLARCFPRQTESSLLGKQIMTVDIFAIAIGITAWTAVLTVAIGCIIVIVMKGPQYTADSYHIDDSEFPAGSKPMDNDQSGRKNRD